jgi:hypothetical protein
VSAAPAGSTEGPPARDPGTQTVKAVVVTVVAVLIAVLVLHHRFSAGSPTAAGATKPTTTTTTINVTNSSTTTTTPLVTPPNIRLQVLNGVLTGNLASEFNAKLHASPGYNTLDAENATAKVGASQIYIVTAGYLPEADALAATLGLSTSSVVATVPPPSTAPIPSADLAKADLVLVIGPDLVAKA